MFKFSHEGLIINYKYDKFSRKKKAFYDLVLSNFHEDFFLKNGIYNSNNMKPAEKMIIPVIKKAVDKE